MTMTGSSGSSSLAARSTPKPSPSGSRRSDSTTPGRLALQRRFGFGLIARFDDGVPLRFERVAQHRAQRVLVLDEQDRGIGELAGRDAHRSQPGGTPARRASSSRSAMAFLRVLRRSCFSRSSSAIDFLTVPLDHGALRRIVAVHEVGRQRVDAGLHRVGVVLVARELVLQRLEPAGPVGLILDRSLLGLVGLGVGLLVAVGGLGGVRPGAGGRRRGRRRSGAAPGSGPCSCRPSPARRRSCGDRLLSSPRRPATEPEPAAQRGRRPARNNAAAVTKCARDRAVAHMTGITPNRYRLEPYFT